MSKRSLTYCTFNYLDIEIFIPVGELLFQYRECSERFCLIGFIKSVGEPKPPKSTEIVYAPGQPSVPETRATIPESNQGLKHQLFYIPKTNRIGLNRVILHDSEITATSQTGLYRFSGLSIEFHVLGVVDQSILCILKKRQKL